MSKGEKKNVTFSLEGPADRIEEIAREMVPAIEGRGVKVLAASVAGGEGGPSVKIK